MQQQELMSGGFLMRAARLLAPSSSMYLLLLFFRRGGRCVGAEVELRLKREGECGEKQERERPRQQRDYNGGGRMLSLPFFFFCVRRSSLQEVLLT